MLALTRKVGESIKIGHDIEVHIYSVGRNKACLSIDAPRSTRIVRTELLDRAARQQLASSRRGGLAASCTSAPLAAPAG